ncbi:IS3 family transposase [Mucilaginibacter sp.]|uniref:IS3 family transposase n=1 Tax=Mucilaginibacter sp. TaxID=1882438 RepID=UPI002CE4CFBC|nr:IS3 family transposase [Mucilaginibacter sp.]HTI58689.1 IS3 family transposase [Mucilaginibacter sp.]
MQLRARGLRELCRLLGYSSQAYYQYQKATESRTFKQEEVLQQVLECRRLQPRLGTRKLLELIQPAMGRDAFFELLRDSGLLVRRKRSRVRTTFSVHRFRKYPNLIAAMEPNRPNQLWVSDITYLRIKQDFAYLSLITDAYSRKIIGFCLSHDLSTDSCLKALRMALATRLTDAPLIHHSDRGTQYCSQAYTRLLKNKGIQISMTQSGNPRDNAIAERVNGILKQELLKESYDELTSAYKAVKEAVGIYNQLRPHSSLDMLTPEKAHQQTGVLKRRWRNYYPPQKSHHETVNLL